MSTSRYTNAGGIGTGTVIDNMQSRVKVWNRAGYSAGVPSIALSFNVASLTDTAVGRLTINHMAPFAVANNIAVLATWASTSWVNKAEGATADVATYHTTYMIENGALCDPGSVHSMAAGNLA